MDINKHLKDLNLASIKRDRKRKKSVSTLPPKPVTEEKIMNIAPTVQKNESPKVKTKKKPKIKKPKVDNTPPKKGFWSKLLGALKSIIFRM